jgi:hypothetical protein
MDLNSRFVRRIRYTIELDITSVSPAAQQEEMQKFVTFISLCNQFPQISLSPTLIVKRHIELVIAT